MNTSLCMANTPGHWATMSSILIWTISWLILSPNGTWRNLYLLRCVLNVMRSEAASVRCIPKKALLPSTLENLVASVSTWAISSRVGALWFSRMIALFKSFGLRHILNLPFAFLGVCERADPWCGLSLFGDDSLTYHLSQLFFISSLYSMGTFHLLCCTGRTVGSVLMSYSPDMSPMQSKMLGEQHLKIPGTVNGCRSRLHIDGVESQSFWWWTTWGLVFHWLCHLCCLRIWNYLTCLINRDHIPGVESFDSFCKGLERSQLLGSILHGLERTCHFLTLWAYGLERSQIWFIFATFGRWSWKETFTCVFVRGLERSLRLCIFGCGLERFWQMVLKGLRFTSLLLL